MANRWEAKKVMQAILVLSLMILTAVNIHAQTGSTYYVSPGGNDAWPGTESQPWASIDHAATMMAPGDTVLIRGGEYHEWVETRYSGLDGAPITFRAYPGEAPILDGTGTGSNDGFSVAGGHSYVRIEGLTIRDFAGNGLVLRGNNSHIDIIDVEITDSGAGIQLTEYSLPGGTVDYLKIEDSYIHANVRSGVNCSPGPCRHVQITGTTLADNGESGLDAADGLILETGEDVAIERCTASGNTGDGFDIKANGARVSRSLAWGNDEDGVRLWGDDVWLGDTIARDNLQAGVVLLSGGVYTMTHNTLSHNTVNPAGYALCVACDMATATDVRLFNNIFAFNGGGVRFGQQTTLTADHNIYYSRADLEIRADFTLRQDFTREHINYGVWYVETGNGYHSGSIDPLFIDAEGRDYHLQAGPPASPAIDSGSNLWASAVDFDGVRRPQGSTVDIGAYEYLPALQLSVHLPVLLR